MEKYAYVIYPDGTKKYEKIYVPDPIPLPAHQLREVAYNTEKVIPWDGEMLTVTEASQKWQYYAAEGNIVKTDALTALIAAAKQTIREQYPDEEGNTQALMGQKNI